jgi:hypothetical protein
VAQGLPERLEKGPTLLASQPLGMGSKVEIAGLLVQLNKRFLPHHVGSKQGHFEPEGTVRWELDAVLHGENPQNTQTLLNPDQVQVGRYRVRFGEPETPKQPWMIHVEDMGCEPVEENGPLSSGEKRVFWISTLGTRQIAFRGPAATAASSGPGLQLELTSGQSLGARRNAVLGDNGEYLTLGWVRLSLREQGDELPRSAEYQDQQIEKARHDFPDHRIEVLRVVYEPNSRIRFRELYTLREPGVSVLLQVTRKGRSKP